MLWTVKTPSHNEATARRSALRVGCTYILSDEPRRREVVTKTGAWRTETASQRNDKTVIE